MIFVTVGTHEQPFNRLIKAIDNIKSSGIIEDEVLIQSGYSDYVPKMCNYKKMLSYEEMSYLAKSARIIITHGGPASIFLAYENNKIPIVVPRQKKYNEHVDDHQLLFSRRLEKQKKILLVEDVELLSNYILDYDNKITNIIKNFDVSGRSVFLQKFKNIIYDIYKS